MDFDLNIENYSKDDYFDIFDLDKNMNPSKEKILENYENLLNNISNENLNLEEKNNMKSFLTNCKDNLLIILMKETENYKLIDTNFIPNLDLIMARIYLCEFTSIFLYPYMMFPSH